MSNIIVWGFFSSCVFWSFSLTVQSSRLYCMSINSWNFLQMCPNCHVKQNLWSFVPWIFCWIFTNNEYFYTTSVNPLGTSLWFVWKYCYCVGCHIRSWARKCLWILWDKQLKPDCTIIIYCNHQVLFAHTHPLKKYLSCTFRSVLF